MSSGTEEKIVPIAIPGIHDKFYSYITPLLEKLKSPKILDLGAGHGAMVKKLHEQGYDITPADLFPEYFYYDKLKCHKVDITKPFPFSDSSFDIIIAVEIMEHVHDHVNFFNEAFRVLKPGGKILITTPNILSLKSRMRFLLSGFFYAFGPLEHERNDGLQHISSLTYDQYKNLAIQAKFTDIKIGLDKKQGTSKFYSFLIPFIKFYCWRKNIDYNSHNKKELLLGRVMFLEITK